MSAIANTLHQREQGSWLAATEKRLLERMAQRMPAWLTPDQLTLLGLGAMLMAGCAFWAAQYRPAMLLLVVVALGLNWFGDSMDGTLARVRRCQRPRYGFYVDHVVDLLGTAFLMGGLAMSGFMSPLVAIVLLAAFFMVEAEVYLATHVCRVFRMAFLRIGPTELRIVLATGVIYLIHSSWVQIGGLGHFRLFDVGGVVAILGMVAAMLVSTMRNTRALYLAEPMPKNGGDEE